MNHTEIAKKILERLFEHKLDNDLDTAADHYATVHHKTIFGEDSDIHPCVTKAIFIQGAWWERHRQEQNKVQQQREE